MKRLSSLLVGSLLCSSALVSAASCGDGGSASTGGAASSSSSSSSSGAGGEGPITIDCKGDSAAVSLAGTWVASGRLAVTLEGVPGGAITICPADQVGESSMLMVMSIKEDPADPTKLTEVKATLCSIELPIVTALVGACDPASKTLVSTQIVVPDSLIKSLPKIATMPVTGALSGKGDGSSLALDRFTVTAGTTKSGDMMPSWDADNPACSATNLGRVGCDLTCVGPADCAAMRDDDGDDDPGVTVQVCGVTPDDIKKGLLCNADMPNEPGTTLQGKAFLDLQVDPLFTGTAKNSCEILGTVDSSVLYNLVGADVYLTGGPISVSSAIKSLPTFKVDATESKFRMIRVDGAFGAPDWNVDPAKGEAACAVALSKVNEL